MPWFDFNWTPGEGGNIEHIADHGVSQDEVEEVVQNPDRVETSRSSGRPIAFGYTTSGKYLAVVYEEVDETTVYPITAYEIED
jgi:uncharacterized DUF497 family protein